jgi:HAE1 family hydrophobic/amphiphilic exporter-1
VRVTFDWGVNLDEAANEVRTRIDRIRATLPEAVEPPNVFKFDISQFPILFLAVSGDKEPREMRTFIEKDIQPRLERAQGVAAVDIRGGLRREIHVSLSNEKLRSLNLSVNQITDILRRENQNRPVGPVEEGNYEVLVRSQGEFENVEQIRNVVIASRNGVPIYIKDVAEVTDAYEEIRQIVRVDGRPGIRLAIRKQSGANTVVVAERVREEIERIHKEFPGISIWPIMDQSQFIERSIDNVGSSAVSGGFLAIMILLLFLRNFRSTMIISTAIPVGVIGTFALMYFYGFTLNTLSFGGLALGVGMLVDSSIVVLENIFRHRESGLSHRDAAVAGSTEVAGPIISSTLTSVAVFVPLIFLTGMTGIMFKELSYVVVFSQFCSLVVGLTLVPLLCSKYLKVRPPDIRSHPFMSKILGASGRLFDQLDERYQRAVHWSLANRAKVMLTTLVLFGGALALVPLIGVEMMPDTDEGEVRVDLELPAGTRVEVTDELAKRIEAVVVREVPELEHILVEVGGGGWQSSSSHTAELRIKLLQKSDRSRSSQEIADGLRPQLNIQPGLSVRARAGSSSWMTRFNRGSDDRVSVEIRGHDMDVSTDLARQVKDVIDSVPGITDSQISRREGMPEMLVTIDRVRAASLGVNASDVADTLEAVIGGRQASEFRQEGDEFAILVRLNKNERSDISHLDQVPVVSRSGQSVPISSLVKMRRQEGPVSIERENQERIVRVSAGFAGRDLGSIMQEIDQKMGGVSAPSGFSFSYGSEYEEQQRSFKELLFSLILALILVYMVMAAQFESLRDPLIILFSVPMAAIGVALMLFLTDTTFNIQGFIGAIMLAGIAVNNAIVLIDYTNLLRRRDKLHLRLAVELAGRRRLRPILMTTLTTVLGLVPMALGFGEGAEVQAPMARVVIGGMLTSTLITLLFIPTLYTMIEERGLHKKEVRSRDEIRGAAPEPVGAD